jgi:hemolysin III
MYQGERFNSITHLIGSVLALIGTSVAVTLAARRGGATSVVAVSIYGAMLVLLYLSSTLYHSFRGSAKRVFRVFDHCSIYLLIAGTYTPFTLTVLRGVWGWTLFAVVWTLAILGVIKDAVFRGRYRAASVVLYLAMGWMVVVAFVPLKHALPVTGLMLLAAGGAVYTLGVVFYALSERVAYTHGVWHLCVIGGSVCHYFAVIGYAVR